MTPASQGGGAARRACLLLCVLILIVPMQEEVDEELRREGRTADERVFVIGDNGGGVSSNGISRVPDTLYSPFSPYRVRVDLDDVLSKELRDL